ncbi:MAG: YraN family protein [Clostridiales bacterium]|jgi:putative endonuclease|nr:YraN family protein [Clostridiales bacterium]
MKTSSTGVLGEQETARWLRERGFRILAANYRTPVGEIDIIASNDKYICFVEVKTRQEGGLLPPNTAVDSKKRSRIVRSASLYLSSNPSTLQPRFDIAEVLMNDGRTKALNYIENAFSTEGTNAYF